MLKTPDALIAALEAYKADLDEIRDNALCEALGAITEKLDPSGDTKEQTIYVDVLKCINGLRKSKKEDAGYEQTK